MLAPLLLRNNAKRDDFTAGRTTRRVLEMFTRPAEREALAAAKQTLQGVPPAKAPTLAPVMDVMLPDIVLRFGGKEFFLKAAPETPEGRLELQAMMLLILMEI